MSEHHKFEREDRYIVIKRKHLNATQTAALAEGMGWLNIGAVECVVVEKDWPEYESVWRMIEDRVERRDRDLEDALFMAFQSSGWSPLLAGKQAEIALSVIRTPPGLKVLDALTNSEGGGE